MEKSAFTPEYKEFLRLLRETCRAAGLTQADVAERLGETQSWVSKCERGERRIDVVELRAFCHVLGLSLATFSQRLDTLLNRPDA